jgi:hypothetical protein
VSLVGVSMCEMDGGVKRRMDGLSSIYQLHGNSTSVFSVGGAGSGSGFIHDFAETSGEKLIGLMGGVEGRK